jgi:hypothetical protein
MSQVNSLGYMFTQGSTIVMKNSAQKFLYRSLVFSITTIVSAGSLWAAPDPAVQARVAGVAKALAAELSSLCPVADPGSSAAFETCRQGLYGDSELRRVLPDFVLWGRQRDPKLELKKTKLTQFSPDVFSSMYVPLFMFDGKHSVVYIEKENIYQIRLQTAFRNRLTPGEFPYPFWHEDEKWSMYEKANEMLFFWDATKNRIKIAQFTVFGENPPMVATSHREHPKFDGKWVWTDAEGKTQPKTSLFDGVFAAKNPYLDKLDVAYKNLALRLRDGQCNQCHVPNNPDGMRKLVLLQTPMHTAAEIKRILRSVREDRMPLDEVGIEQPLDPATKEALLKEGVAFDQMLDAAKLWEVNNKNKAAAL